MKHLYSYKFRLSPTPEQEVRLFFERNTLIAKEADQVIAFLVEGLKCNGTMDTVDKAKGMGKPVFVFIQN